MGNSKIPEFIPGTVVTWVNDSTQLNATNLNALSDAISTLNNIIKSDNSGIIPEISDMRSQLTALEDEVTAHCDKYGQNIISGDLSVEGTLTLDTNKLILTGEPDARNDDAPVKMKTLNDRLSRFSLSDTDFILDDGDIDTSIE